MNNYIFKTTATMKEYNCRKWWIDSNIITEKRITAANIAEALQQYRERVTNEHYISISDNAAKNKSPMYIDTPTGTKQKGYVITAKTDFQDDFGRWTAQYIDLWIDILTVTETDFTE